MSKEDYIV